jgi:glycosyltransferase involved in cell wall biosynthesis
MTIITPSNWLLGLIKQSFLKEYPVKLINNGIDLNTFKPTKSGFRIQNGLSGKFVILGVANVWDKRKGFDTFVELSKQTEDCVVIVGLNDKQLKQLPQNIIGIKHTNSVKELAEIYTAADVFVNPTQEDNFPTTNLEAFACGTPVITYNTGGSAECIDDKSGIVVEKNDISKLVSSINKIKALGKKEFETSCINRAVNFYDKNNKYMEYILLMESLAK